MRPLFACLALLVLSSFQIHKKHKPKLPSEFVSVPAGTVHITEGPTTVAVAVQEFYMSKYEVSNLQYRNFYNEVAPALSERDRERIACDSAGWDTLTSSNQPMIQLYHRHPAFNNYPAVNISYEGAMAYCKWLQEKLSKENPEFEIEVTLPTYAQWIYAARGGRSQALYPWNTYHLRNNKGQKLCNFKSVNDYHIYRNRKTGKAEVAEFAGSPDLQTFTSSVNSFKPNDFGLYNMCGNVAEMITEKGKALGGSWNDFGGDVHIMGQCNYERSAATVGFRPVILIVQKASK